MSGIPSWARVGAKVVCVDDQPKTQYVKLGCIPPQLTSGSIYTIRWVGSYTHILSKETYPGVRLSGIVQDFADTAFNIDRFKPVITLEDDISTHFAALLDVKQPSPVSA